MTRVATGWSIYMASYQ